MLQAHNLQSCLLAVHQSTCRPDKRLKCGLLRYRSGIANLDYFTNAPVLLMYGFMCVALTAAIWDNLATLLYLPVSTTHTTGARDSRVPTRGPALHSVLATHSQQALSAAIGFCRTASAIKQGQMAQLLLPAGRCDCILSVRACCISMT